MVGGLVAVPVIAVPTSIGYGASVRRARGAAGDAQLLRGRRHGRQHRQRLRRGRLASRIIICKGDACVAPTPASPHGMASARAGMPDVNRRPPRPSKRTCERLPSSTFAMPSWLPPGSGLRSDGDSHARAHDRRYHGCFLHRERCAASATVISRPQRLVALREVPGQTANPLGTISVNERHFEYWRGRAKSFESMAQYRVVSANLTGVGEAAQIVLARSSGSLFQVLGEDAALGRTLAATDDPEGTPDVVIISDAVWRQHFRPTPRWSDNRGLDGRPYAIVGVLRPDFRLPGDNQQIDTFIPIRVTVGWVGDHNDQAIGRLRSGVTLEQARAELDVLQKEVGVLASKESRDPVILSSAVTPLAEYVVGSARRGLLLLFGAIAAVLLIACSNLANLALTRNLGRAREAAIRSAIGAPRRRLLARILLEQLVLSTVGGLLGIWVARLGLGIFVRTAPIDVPRVQEVAVDAQVLAFAAIISILTGLLVALVPAWRSGNSDILVSLRAGARSATDDRSARRSHSTLSRCKWRCR